MLSWLRILNSIKVWDEINKRIGIVKSGWWREGSSSNSTTSGSPA
jgi:hypothetical protein